MTEITISMTQKMMIKHALDGDDITAHRTNEDGSVDEVTINIEPSDDIFRDQTVLDRIKRVAKQQEEQ